ncbi:MAG: hypothetical protein GX808_13855 [Syntrophomonadaceae bacterium]|nr:hypothetical protein [Syntrophomonadaceae bacterium]
MIIEIKMKEGFFKTQPYYMTIETGKIILTPQDDSDSKRLVIEEQELRSVSITSTNMTLGELEITTRDHIYIGNLTSHNDLGEIANHFAREFGEKFVFQRGNI